MTHQLPKDWTATLRIAGNTLTIVGYTVLLHVNPLAGSAIKIVGFGLVMPFCWKAKLYDVMLLAAAFGILDLSNIVKLIIKIH